LKSGFVEEAVPTLKIDALCPAVVVALNVEAARLKLPRP